MLLSAQVLRLFDGKSLTNSVYLVECFDSVSNCSAIQSLTQNVAFEIHNFASVWSACPVSLAALRMSRRSSSIHLFSNSSISIFWKISLMSTVSYTTLAAVHPKHHQNHFICIKHQTSDFFTWKLQRHLANLTYSIGFNETQNIFPASIHLPLIRHWFVSTKSVNVKFDSLCLTRSSPSFKSI